MEKAGCLGYNFGNSTGMRGFELAIVLAFLKD